MTREEVIKQDMAKLQAELDQIKIEKNKSNLQKQIDKYKSTYSGSRLIQKHSLSDYGVWKINGEDPNCDLGGSHSNPYLCTVEGTLENVIKHAVALQGFWQWGGGGVITKIEEKEIKKV